MTTDEQTERRENDSLVLKLLNEVRDDLKTMRAELSKHIEDERSEIASSIENAFIRAFPDGDPDGHRAVHESYIAAAKEKAEFWKKISFEITKWGLFGFLGWAAYALWETFLRGPHK